MNKFIKNIAILVSTLVVLATMSITQLTYASDFISNFEKVPAMAKSPLKVGTWGLTPTIIVCEYAPISQTQVNSAVMFWKGLGHKFYSTQYKHDPLNKCMNPQPVGYIVIHLVTMGVPMEQNALAQTHFFVENHSNEIKWAIIYMRSDVKKTVLEHEIGHALGYLHYNKIGHLMHAKHIQGGWDSEGLKK